MIKKKLMEEVLELDEALNLPQDTEEEEKIKQVSGETADVLYFSLAGTVKGGVSLKDVTVCFSSFFRKLLINKKNLLGYFRPTFIKS